MWWHEWGRWVRKGKHTSESINQSNFDMGGLYLCLSALFLRLWCCISQPFVFVCHTIIWAKVFACCRVLSLPTRITENGEGGQASPMRPCYVYTPGLDLAEREELRLNVIVDRDLCHALKLRCGLLNLPTSSGSESGVTVCSLERYAERPNPWRAHARSFCDKYCSSRYEYCIRSAK